MHALRAAFAGLIDYAGLFPPASLDLPHVVENHVRYALSPDCWLLGRLIAPLARLDELAHLVDAMSTPEPWTISALAQPGELDETNRRIAQFNEREARGWAVVAVEASAATPDEVTRIAQRVSERYERYVEVPLDDRLPGLLDAVAEAGCYAKARTGGIAASAFPASSVLSRFMAECISRDVPFKATAGLHHPIRGSYPLTYEPQSPSTVMHGFVNLVVAAGLLKAGVIDDREAASVLDRTDANAFRAEPDGIRLGTHILDAEACMTTRAHVLRSIGSCSFEDALADLRTLQWLDTRAEG